jgi:hypothetical protein
MTAVDALVRAQPAGTGASVHTGQRSFCPVWSYRDRGGSIGQGVAMARASAGQRRVPAPIPPMFAVDAELSNAGAGYGLEYKWDG